MKTLLLFLIHLCVMAQPKPDSTKSKKGWDVNNAPETSGYKTVEFTTNEGSWMNLDVSPDGQTVVFDLLGDIYRMPITGGKATPLRTGSAWEIQPRFSPDGRKISFTNDAGGDNLWVMQADGSNPRQVTKEDFGSSTMPFDRRWRVPHCPQTFHLLAFVGRRRIVDVPPQRR